MLKNRLGDNFTSGILNNLKVKTNEVKKDSRKGRGDRKRDNRENKGERGERKPRENREDKKEEEKA